MRYSRLLFLWAAFFSVVFFYSCVPQKQVTTHQQELAMIDSQLAEHSRKLKQLDAERQKKQDGNEISDTASVMIQKFIGLTNAEIDKLLAQNSILIGNTSVNKSDWNRLKSAFILSQGRSRLIGDKVSLITDLLNRNTVVRLEQDVIFGPGQYNLTPVVAASISRMFEPVAKEIDYFVTKYPSFPLSLVITARGYADATTIGEGSFLYRKLKDRLKLNTPNPGKEDLNKELSVARAESVIALLKTFTIGKSSDGSNVKNLLLLYEGKGEKLPDPKVTDYKTDDARRRIVLLFWSIFPE
jgi:outer membrane protein OmpA-like peptidoglycan-associated protein